MVSSWSSAEQWSTRKRRQKIRSRPGFEISSGRVSTPSPPTAHPLNTFIYIYMYFGVFIRLYVARRRYPLIPFRHLQVILEADSGEIVL